MSPFEVWLPLGALGLYLFDSMSWLYSNELLLLRRGEIWSCARGPALLVAGRRVYLPNPLTPGTAQFKVRWSESDPRQEQEDSAELDRFFTTLRPVQYLVNTLLVILIALPLELFLYGTGFELLAVMAAFYLVILVSLTYIYLRRRELRLSGRAFATVCFDALACAPFAINLVRKLTLRRSLAGNPIAFTARVFARAAFARVLEVVGARVAEEQVREDGQTARWLELEGYRQRLLAMVTEKGE